MTSLERADPFAGLAASLVASLVVGLLALATAGASRVVAETMSGALARAYANNPALNFQRAGVRMSDESVPQAKAGFMPRINASSGYGAQNRFTSDDPTAPGRQRTTTPAANFDVTIVQTLFDGQRTVNSVRQAEHGVLAARQILRQTEAETLQAAAAAYMDVLRDTAIVDLNRNNVEALITEARDAGDRFAANQVMRTDVAQAESSLASARADLASARSRLQTSVAAYRRVIGMEPKQLQPARPIEKLLPGGLELAIATAMERSPSIRGALEQVDVASAAVKAAEGALLPTAVAQGTIQRPSDQLGLPDNVTFLASVGGQIDIPVYQGGSEYAAIRQSKEQLNQAGLAVDAQRATIRSAVSASWARLASARATIVADEAAVKARAFSLMGLREEAKDGLRTTQDILNAHKDLLDARIGLVSAQHDRVVASYEVMAAVGQLSARRLGLSAPFYDPKVHYRQTRDRFFGVITPDGR